MSQPGNIAYCSPLIPPEWIAAYGLQPVPIMPKGAVGHDFERPGLCPFTKALFHSIASHPAIDAAVLVTSCDQMRRASEWIAERCSRPVFLFNLPKAVDSPGGVKLYRSELKRLGLFLQSFGGVEPSDDQLAETMARSQQQREASSDGRTATADGKIPLLLIGGPMIESHLSIYRMITESGGSIAADGTTSPFPSSDRTSPVAFDRRRLYSEPFKVLVQSYYPAIPTVDQRPNSRLYQWIKRMIHEREIRGIIVRHFIWCDLWHAEAHRMYNWSPVPVLTLDMDEEQADKGQIRTRISAFLEMLR